MSAGQNNTEQQKTIVVETEKLTKEYRRFEKEPGLLGSVKSLFNRKFVTKTAVDSLDLKISQGEFTALIGPNGAGKTTLVKMLTGIIAPSSGRISVLGYYPNKLENAFKRQYAVVMGQKSQLFFELTPLDTFALFRELYNIPPDVYKRNVDYFVDIFGVSGLLNVQVRTLSLGERMKMELITALLHSPQILFLDEPTIGLDAAAQRQIRTFLREVNREQGTTIILTSHYMEDVRSLCGRSIVISGGRKIYDGDTERLFASYQIHKKITLLFETECTFAAPPGAVVIEQSPWKAVFMVPKEQSGELLQSIIALYPLRDITVEEDDLGGVVERIYTAGGEAR
ncbi:ABC transporter ATP-binding protein [Leadbettera azotonutricia]|uniref:ABC transporter, ATP-binding protein n=1 Tax=Leadbettera azotonutricia (strain ATCC BAA-888 / DSM 13862 / ZAS-9) TaxID=545695 RepID=F5Y8G5_LEAAZ|nr:ATP-binding cassette domain-containing protein [Leadbettera azotonutricia]AEF82199.1 ABC transporter, ATP-binding protein [Leadbettera azotonutricia ZAS-9]